MHESQAHLLRPVLKDAFPLPPRPPAPNSTRVPAVTSSASGFSCSGASLRRMTVPGGTWRMAALS